MSASFREAEGEQDDGTCLPSSLESTQAGLCPSDALQQICHFHIKSGHYSSGRPALGPGVCKSACQPFKGHFSTTALQISWAWATLVFKIRYLGGESLRCLSWGTNLSQLKGETPSFEFPLEFWVPSQLWVASPGTGLMAWLYLSLSYLLRCGPPFICLGKCSLYYFLVFSLV